MKAKSLFVVYLPFEIKSVSCFNIAISYPVFNELLQFNVILFLEIIIFDVFVYPFV